MITWNNPTSFFSSRFLIVSYAISLIIITARIGLNIVEDWGENDNLLYIISSTVINWTISRNDGFVRHDRSDRDDGFVRNDRGDRVVRNDRSDGLVSNDRDDRDYWQRRIRIYQR